MTKEPSFADTAVLLLAFGGPDSLNSIKPFLNSVLKGRQVTPKQVNKVKERYKLIGGKSPLLAITKKQARALENKLSNNFSNVQVYVGMKHWHPFIEEVVFKMFRDGIKRIIVVNMAVHNSKASTGGYQKSLAAALKKSKAAIEVDFVKKWHKNPLFLELLADRINKALSAFKESARKNVYIIFSAHSLPKKLVKNDSYIKDVNETVKGVMNLVGSYKYKIAYQSGVKGNTEWLGPDVGSVLEELSEKEIKDALIVPVSFVSDHVETLYDIDVVYKNKAKSLGINLRRTASFNDSADFTNLLANIVSKKLKEQGGIR